MDYNISKNTNTNMKQTIRLNEADLHRIVRESVKKVLRESIEMDNGAPYYLYVNYDCVGEYDSLDDAKKEAILYYRRDKTAVIDINDCTDENSVWGVNS